MDYITFILERIQSIDWTVLYALQRLRTPSLDTFFSHITLLGSAGIIWIIFAIIFLLRKKSRRFGFLLLIALGVSFLAGTELIKYFVQRPRPFVQDPSVQLLIGIPSGTSFPSGHSLTSFLAAYMICRYDRRPGIFAFILAVIIAFSRMYLFVHFPSDVLAGIIIGLVFGWIFWKIGGRWALRTKR